MILEILKIIDNENGNFIDFLFSDYYSRIMRESKISIHIEIVNLYYENRSTGKSSPESTASEKETDRIFLFIRWQLPGISY